MKQRVLTAIATDEPKRRMDKVEEKNPAQSKLHVILSNRVNPFGDRSVALSTAKKEATVVFFDSSTSTTKDGKY